MVARMSLCDPASLETLLDELRRSMRTLLHDVCHELHTDYARSVTRLALPVDLFRLIGEALPQEAFSNWKVVGWIEELNDLLFFVDVMEQLRGERDRRVFAERLLEDSADLFYEHSYREELFPEGEPDPVGLSARLSALSVRLARRITQEAVFLIPRVSCQWVATQRKRELQVPWAAAHEFERVECAGTIPVGYEGERISLPGLPLGKEDDATSDLLAVIRPDGISMTHNGHDWPVYSLTPGPVCHGTFLKAAPIAGSSMTLGPALIYGKDLTPRRIGTVSRRQAERVAWAISIIRQVWPVGAAQLALLTSRVVPLWAGGVVSFSYRTRPGLSVVNVFDRDDLDLIDDLIHENSHHHLNLLLRKYRMQRRDRSRELFYSPWRRSLRPLRGILHATFTFTMGAMLFERISTAAAAKTLPASGGGSLSKEQVLRARFRCLEELESVRYSMNDLRYAADQLQWLTAHGVALVDAMDRAAQGIRRKIEPFRAQVMRSKYGADLRAHVASLQEAKQAYGKARESGLR